MDFAIVRFIEEEDAPGIISAKWIDSKNTNTCWYPNARTEEKKNKLLLSHASPQKEWLKCPMRILKTFPNYNSARSHLREAEDTSNLDSDIECTGPRKRIKKSQNFPDSSSEDESQSQSLLAPKQKILSYPPPPFSSLTFSSLPAAVSPPNIINPVVDCSIKSSNEVMNNKLEKILSNQQSMFRLVEDFIQSNKRLELKLDSIIAQQQAQPISHTEENDAVNFISLLPVGVEEFLSLDLKIAESSSFKKRLTNFLLTISGKDAKVLVFNLLRRLVTDDVGEKYSLTGKSSGAGQKLPFEKTEVYKLILEICFRTFKDAKLNIVREGMSDWLMQSKFRKSKREKRSLEKENCS